MRCPFCSEAQSRVTDSRVAEDGIRRRRECLSCRRRFTTYERVQAGPLLVSKRDGRREEFSREKLLSGLRKACAKRPVPGAVIEGLVDEIESGLAQRSGAEIPASDLGTIIMERLREIDRVAYIRYASVYRDFQDIESFEKAVRDLRDESPQLPLLDLPPGRPSARRRRTGRTAANPGQPSGPPETPDSIDNGGTDNAASAEGKANPDAAPDIPPDAGAAESDPPPGPAERTAAA